MRLEAFLIFLPLGAAFPAKEPCKPKVKPWKPAGHGDSRGPCPILNTLANHGYLPHHGRNITIEQFGIAMHEGLGWSPDTGRIPASGVFGVLNLTTTIDLEQLDNRAAGIEHAASIARADDSNDVVPARVQDLLDDSNDPTNLTPGSLALTRIRLEKTSPISEREQQQSVGEAAFVIAAMLNGTVPPTGTEGVDYASFKAPKSWAEDWLAHERLPVKLGWTRSKREVTLGDLAGINTAINAAISKVTSHSRTMTDNYAGSCRPR